MHMEDATEGDATAAYRDAVIAFDHALRIIEARVRAHSLPTSREIRAEEQARYRLAKAREALWSKSEEIH
jgi:hypothetical protein